MQQASFIPIFLKEKDYAFTLPLELCVVVMSIPFNIVSYKKIKIRINKINKNK